MSDAAGGHRQCDGARGSSNGTISGADGKFPNLRHPACVGRCRSEYQNPEIPVNGRTELQVRLRKRAADRRRLSWSAASTQDKKTTTGSVHSVVKMADIGNVPKSTVSPIAALAGRAAGMRVNQVSAQPEGGVRSASAAGLSDMSNSPLVVIDELPVTRRFDARLERIYESGSTDLLLPVRSSPKRHRVDNRPQGRRIDSHLRLARGHGVILITTKRGAKSARSDTQAISRCKPSPSTTKCSPPINFCGHAITGRAMRYLPGPIPWVCTPRFMTAPSGTIPEYVPAYTDDQIKHLKGTDWTDGFPARSITPPTGDLRCGAARSRSATWPPTQPS